MAKWRHLLYFAAVAVTITIRKVPDDVRDELAARAARAGRSLQEHLLAELIDLASRPSVDAWLQRTRDRARVTGTRLSRKRILSHLDAERG